MRGRWGTRRGTWLCGIRHLNNRQNSASMDTARSFLMLTVFFWLIIKTFVKPLVSTTGSVNCWTKMECCSNWCLEVLWYFDTMYMLFEKKKSIGYMYFKSMEKCAQRIRRFLKISQKIGSKRWSLPSFLKISAVIREILFSLICMAIFTIFPVGNRNFFYL